MTNAGVAPGRGERGVRRTADRFVPRSRKNPFSNVPRGARAWIDHYLHPTWFRAATATDGAGGGGAAAALLLIRLFRTGVGVGLGTGKRAIKAAASASGSASLARLPCETEDLERWQRAAVERSGEDGAAGVGDLGVYEVQLRSSHLSFANPPVGGGSGPGAGSGGATRAARPSSPNGLKPR